MVFVFTDCVMINSEIDAVHRICWSNEQVVRNTGASLSIRCHGLFSPKNIMSVKVSALDFL